MSLGELGSISAERRPLHVEWQIKDFFRKSVYRDEFWMSPKFHVSGETLYLSVYPKGQTNAKGFVSVYLHKHEPGTSIQRFSFIIGIKAIDGSFYANSATGTGFITEKGFGFPKLVKEGQLLQDRNIVEYQNITTFFCTICFPVDCKVDASHQTSFLDDFTTSSTDYKNLFLSGSGTDVTIKVKSENFQAHSLILGARSPVFAPMFSHEMKEKNDGVVDVDDCNPAAFKEFLLFLYSGRTENITSENVVEVYCIAEKYNAEELKSKCSDFMKNTMSVDIFCDVVSAAVRYSDTDLIDHAKGYFVKNMKQILASVKWIPFSKEYPVESNELIISAVDSLSNNLK